MTNNTRTLTDLLAILGELGAEYVVIGGLAAGFHGRVRATVDVNLLVHRSHLKKIGAALEALGYRVRFFPDMLRAYPANSDDAAESVADLVACEANPTLLAASKAIQRASLLGHEVSLVRKGAFVAMKFHAAVSPSRQLGDRYQDLVDIERVVTRVFSLEDRALALDIADTMYPGARADLDQALNDLAAGKPVKLERTAQFTCNGLRDHKEWGGLFLFP